MALSHPAHLCSRHLERLLVRPSRPCSRLQSPAIKALRPVTWTPNRLEIGDWTGQLIWTILRGTDSRRLNFCSSRFIPGRRSHLDQDSCEDFASFERGKVAPGLSSIADAPLLRFFQKTKKNRSTSQYLPRRTCFGSPETDWALLPVTITFAPFHSILAGRT